MIKNKIGGTKDDLTLEENVADYLLFRLNQRITSRQAYVQQFRLSEPTDDINFLLDHIGRIRGKFINSRQNSLLNIPLRVDTTASARYFINLYRKGDFGRFTLDDCSETNLKEYFSREFNA